MNKDKFRSRRTLWVWLGFGALLTTGLLSSYPWVVSQGLVWILGLLGSWLFFFGVGALIYGSYCWVEYKKRVKGNGEKGL